MTQAQQVGLKSRSCRGNYADTIVFYVRSRSPKIVALLYKLPIPVEGASDVTKQPQKDVVSVLFVGKQTRLDGSLTVDATLMGDEISWSDEQGGREAIAARWKHTEPLKVRYAEMKLEQADRVYQAVETGRKLQAAVQLPGENDEIQIPPDVTALGQPMREGFLVQEETRHVELVRSDPIV